MDAHALLTSQGWRGTGHSLHATSDDTGLRRPILVSQKKNVLGIGQKQHRTSDMWWMNAFDKSLKGLDTSKDGAVVQTLTTGGLDMVAKGGSKYVGKEGLYACFVRGEVLGGSLGDEETSSASDPGCKKGVKRKSKETKEERRVRKEAKRHHTAITQAEAQSPPALPIQSTDEIKSDEKHSSDSRERRKERKRQKKLLEQSTEGSEARANADKEKRRKRKEGE